MEKANEIFFRKAIKSDLSDILELIFDDVLAKNREDLSNRVLYEKAFDQIHQDTNQLLLVGCNQSNEMIATCQLTLIPNLTYQGRSRLLIEAVRVHQSFRGLGIGSQLIQYAITFAKQKNCCMVQLTMDKKRGETLAFYQSLGFINSHEGFKLFL